MIIPKSVYYGLRGLAYLARTRKLCSIAEISEKEGVSLPFLEKIFQKLKKAGLVDSKKGLSGGYFLKMAPRKIKMAKIMETLGQDLGPKIPCLIKTEKCCGKARICSSKKAWEKLHKSFQSSIEAVTLTDFL